MKRRSHVAGEARGAHAEERITTWRKRCASAWARPAASASRAEAADFAARKALRGGPGARRPAPSQAQAHRGHGHHRPGPGPGWRRCAPNLLLMHGLSDACSVRWSESFAPPIRSTTTAAHERVQGGSTAQNPRDYARGVFRGDGTSRAAC
jgi:hypothetical protein